VIRRYEYEIVFFPYVLNGIRLVIDTVLNPLLF